MKSETLHSMTFIAAFLAVVLGAWIVMSHLEARAFNRVSGQNVSTLDAMFLRLRVEANADD